MQGQAGVSSCKATLRSTPTSPTEQPDSELGVQVRGRVKSVYSIVKKLLRQRGVSREDLKAQAIKASQLQVAEWDEAYSKALPTVVHAVSAFCV